MTVLVTGGTGVVGAAVVRRLVAEDRAVRGLSRSEESDAKLTALGAEPVRGDILDPPSLRDAASGADVVYHIAGLNKFCLRDPTPLLEVNVEGSRNVVQACRNMGVRRLVYTSSAAALGEPAGTVGTEDSPHRGSYLSHYERSKHLAEQAVMADAGDLEVVAVNPSSAQGPGRATGTGKLILDLVNGRLPALVDTRLSMVDIDDCALGHLLAEEKGRPGERYLLNGFTVDTRTAVEMLERVLGRRIRVRFVPGRLAMVGAGAAEALARLLRRRPPVCREMVRTMLHGHAYDGSRATRELGLAYTPPEDTLAKLIDWYRREGLLEG